MFRNEGRAWVLATLLLASCSNEADPQQTPRSAVSPVAPGMSSAADRAAPKAPERKPDEKDAEIERKLDRVNEQLRYMQRYLGLPGDHD